MRQGIRILGTILLAVAVSSPAWAKPGKGKGGGSTGSQAGGLPALAQRVAALETTVATLTPLVGEVAALTTAVNELETDVTDLETAVTDLAGQNNFAQGVETASTCTLGATSSSVVSATFISLGVCQVTFDKDVSGCSAVASIVGTAGGEISVASATKTATGDSWNVATFAAGLAAASDFNLTVTCP